MEVITTLNEKILSMFPSSVAFVVSKSPIGPFTILILLVLLLLGLIVFLFGFSGPTEDAISGSSSKNRRTRKQTSGVKKKVQIVAPEEEEEQVQMAKPLRSSHRKMTPFPTKAKKTIKEEVKVESAKRQTKRAAQAAKKEAPVSFEPILEDDSEWVVATKGKGNRGSLEALPVQLETGAATKNNTGVVQSKRQQKRANKKNAEPQPPVETPAVDDEWTVIKNKKSRKSGAQE